MRGQVVKSRHDAGQQIVASDACVRGKNSLGSIRSARSAARCKRCGARLNSGVRLVPAILDGGGMLDMRGWGCDSYRSRRRDVAV